MAVGRFNYCAVGGFVCYVVAGFVVVTAVIEKKKKEMQANFFSFIA